MANLQQGHRIHFAIGTILRFEHENMKQTLLGYNEVFEERLEKQEAGTAGLFRRARFKDTAIILGSTALRELIATIFESYMSWAAFSWPFLFAMAAKEPRAWTNLVHAFSPYHNGEKLTPSDTLEDTYCIMVTHHEHGMLLVSDKITVQQLETVSKDIAARNLLQLEVRIDRHPNKSVSKD